MSAGFTPPMRLACPMSRGRILGERRCDARPCVFVTVASFGRTGCGENQLAEASLRTHSHTHTQSVKECRHRQLRRQAFPAQQPSLGELLPGLHGQRLDDLVIQIVRQAAGVLGRHRGQLLGLRSSRVGRGAVGVGYAWQAGGEVRCFAQQGPATGDKHTRGQGQSFPRPLALPPSPAGGG